MLYFGSIVLDFRFPHTIICILITAALLSCPYPVAGQTLDPVEIAQKLQSTYEKATNVVADFNQTTTMQFSSRIRKGSGTMIFLKPGRMRWDYISPDTQVLISDGETISMYFEKSNQMIVSSAKDYLQSDVTYSFFAGTGDLLQDFVVSAPDFTSSQEESFIIKLTPKSTHPHVSSMHVWVTRDTFLITHLQIIDHFDTITDLNFKNIKMDTDHYGSHMIQDDLFSFTPPANTEIIQQF